MKNQFYLLFFAIAFVAFAPAAIAVNPDKAVSKTADEYLIQEGPLSGLTVEEAMTMKPKEIKARTGQKLKFGERLGLKVLQRKYRKAKKKGEEFAPEDARDNLFGIIGLSIAGFGLLFGWIIWPIALLFGIAGLVLGIIGLKRDSEPTFSWAAIGVGGAAILIAIIILIVVI